MGYERPFPWLWDMSLNLPWFCCCLDRLSVVRAPGPPVFRSAPREVVLDRWAGHTAICPDSLRAFRAFSLARNMLGVASALAACVLLVSTWHKGSAAGADPELAPLIK